MGSLSGNLAENKALEDSVLLGRDAVSLCVQFPTLLCVSVLHSSGSTSPKTLMSRLSVMMVKCPGRDSNRVPSKYKSQVLTGAILLGRVGGKNISA